MYPGSYRVCVWLDDQQAANPDVSDSLMSSSVTVVPASYTFTMHAPRSIRIGSAVQHDLQFETFTFKAGGQTTAHRAIDFAVQPPGVRKCAPDIGAGRWSELERGTRTTTSPRATPRTGSRCAPARIRISAQTRTRR